MITVEAAKSNFFDRRKVTDDVGPKAARFLSRAGAEVRKEAQRGIKMSPDGKPSRPGARPYGHHSGLRKRASKSTGKTRLRKVSLLREFIFFSYDRATRTVVVGPALLSNTLAGAAALKALEYGGTSIVSAGRAGKTRPVRVRARPFMRPALAAAAPNFPAILRASV